MRKEMKKAYRDMVELIHPDRRLCVQRQKRKVKKGFGDVMGGKVLELESDKLIQIQFFTKSSCAKA